MAFAETLALNLNPDELQAGQTIWNTTSPGNFSFSVGWNYICSILNTWSITKTYLYHFNKCHRVFKPFDVFIIRNFEIITWFVDGLVSCPWNLDPAFVWNQRTNWCLSSNPLHKNIERHTADTIVSWPNPRQWVIVHTSDLMMIIRQSIYILSIITREMSKLKTYSPTYCIMDNGENMLNLTHTLDKIYLTVIL